MPCQEVGAIETLGTSGALVRPGIFVRPEVSGQVVGSLIDATADMADVRRR